MLDGVLENQTRNLHDAAHRPSRFAFSPKIGEKLRQVRRAEALNLYSVEAPKVRLANLSVGVQRSPASFTVRNLRRECLEERVGDRGERHASRRDSLPVLERALEPAELFARLVLVLGRQLV